MAGLALAAYIVGRRTPLATGPHRLADLERRLAELEDERRDRDPGSLVSESAVRSADKEYTALHYETLAHQATQEHRMDGLDVRLTEIELRRHASRAARCTNREGATTGESRHG